MLTAFPSLFMKRAQPYRLVGGTTSCPAGDSVASAPQGAPASLPSAPNGDGKFTACYTSRAPYRICARMDAVSAPTSATDPKSPAAVRAWQKADSTLLNTCLLGTAKRPPASLASS